MILWRVGNFENEKTKKRTNNPMKLPTFDKKYGFKSRLDMGEILEVTGAGDAEPGIEPDVEPAK